MAEPSYSRLSASHFYAWGLGLKTGQYYLRSRPARDAIKFTLNVESLMKTADGKKNASIFENMNTNNKTQAEMDLNKRKKRRVNEIAPIKDEGTFKEPEQKTTVKECPFNPFGEDDCEACGS
jgi:hypothetical protein